MRESLAAAQPAPYGQVLREARPSATVAQQVAAYVALSSQVAGQPAGRIAGSFDRRGRTDSAAGRLVADAQWAATRDAARGGAQVALMNPGGIRTDLLCAGTPPCAVSYGEAFAMQPFGNSLVVMTLSGAELKALLESQQPQGRDKPSFLAPSQGLSYRWLASAPAGQRVADLRLNGVPVAPGAELRVTVNSFMADGGDGFRLLRQGRNRLGGELDLDALIAHLAGNPAPQATARIEWVD